MRNAAIGLVLVLLGSVLFCQEMVAGQVHDVSWDPVTVDSGTVEYDVSVESLDDASLIVLARVTDPPAQVTIPEGNWKLGVTSVRIAPDTTETISTVNWSDVDDPVGSTPNPFVLQFWQAPDPVEGLRLQ